MKHYVNKIIYILLAVFLGGIGIHKLYARHYTSFVLYLLFSSTGIPVFLTIFDVIIAVLRPSDPYGFIEV